jgi:hypothetical protein
MKDIIVADGQVKQIARSDALWIVVWIIGARSGNAEELGTVLRSRIEVVGADGSVRRSIDASAEEPALELLIGSQSGDVSVPFGP